MFGPLLEFVSNSENALKGKLKTQCIRVTPLTHWTHGVVGQGIGNGPIPALGPGGMPRLSHLAKLHFPSVVPRASQLRHLLCNWYSCSYFVSLSKFSVGVKLTFQKQRREIKRIWSLTTWLACGKENLDKFTLFQLTESVFPLYCVDLCELETLVLAT